MYTSVDKVMDKVERQIRRVKGREQARKGPGAETTREGMEPIEAEAAEEGPEEDEEVAASEETAQVEESGEREESDGS